MKNKELGLPYGDKMEKVAICFDVDGTLISEDFSEITQTVDLLFSLLWQPFKNVDIIIWSGGGQKYAEHHISRRLPEDLSKKVKYYSKLQHKEVRQKYDLIIAIDDIQDTRLGDINLIVRNK